MIATRAGASPVLVNVHCKLLLLTLAFVTMGVRMTIYGMEVTRV